MSDVWLDPLLLWEAVEVGLRRYTEAEAQQRKDRLNNPSPGDHVLGAVGELAFCVHTCTAWPKTVNTFRQPDATMEDRTKVEIRSTRYGSKLPLKVRDDDPDDWMVAGVAVEEHRVGIGVTGRCEIIGWTLAGEAKQEIWFRDPGNRGRPAYFVPIERLRPVPGRVPPIDVGWMENL